MKNILITGGPVHAYLDAVKIITNRYRGGFMCQLAEDLLAYDTTITYLCAPLVGACVPKEHERIRVVTHQGFNDYYQKVLDIAPTMDGIILGAAVANLIPTNPFTGKFPSHNFQPGQIIPIDFTVSPRIINDIKRVAPRTHLFGYKLLSDVSHDELIRAAYGVVLESQATAVFANDAQSLEQKFAVTKERGVHPLLSSELGPWIWEMLNDVYYATTFEASRPIPANIVEQVHSLIKEYAPKFLVTEHGLIFGTVAVRCDSGFVTTGRGKRELDSSVYVTTVDHLQRKVFVAGETKASLNAPLLSRMFENPGVDVIVHYHQMFPGLPIEAYAPPGTVRDSDRPNQASFNIREHGCMLLFDRMGRQI